MTALIGVGGSVTATVVHIVTAVAALRHSTQITVLATGLERSYAVSLALATACLELESTAVEFMPVEVVASEDSTQQAYLFI